jgi:hypothetical protein
VAGRNLEEVTRADPGFNACINHADKSLPPMQ